jgi:hypothetical protein
MSSPRVKVSKSGLIYLNQEKVSPDKLIAELLRYKEQGYGAYYYREEILSDPSPEILEIFNSIVSAGIPIKMGNEAGSEWGALETFMLIAVDEFHFAIFKEGIFTFIPEVGPQLPGYHSKTPHAPAILREVDTLISANRVIETPPTAPEKTIQKETLITPSLQVLIQYAGNKVWRSYYLKHQVPDNIKSLMSDCQKLGLSLVGANG